MAWFTAEHRVLLAAIERAVAAGFDFHVWQLAATLKTFLGRQAHWQAHWRLLVDPQITARWERRRSLGLPR